MVDFFNRENIPPGINYMEKDDDGFPICGSEDPIQEYPQYIGSNSTMCQKNILDCLKSYSTTASKEEILKMIHLLLDVLPNTSSKEK